MSILFSAFIGAFALTLLIVRWSRTHAHLTNDHDLSGPQKFHAHPVPRIGGLGIVFGVAICAGMLWWRDPANDFTAPLLLLCGLPAFAAGIAEDITKRVSPRPRLIATPKTMPRPPMRGTGCA